MIKNHGRKAWKIDAIFEVSPNPAIELFVWAVLEFCAPLFIVSYSFDSFISSYYFDSLTEAVNIWVLRINFQKTFPETLIFSPKNVYMYSTFFWQLTEHEQKSFCIIESDGLTSSQAQVILPFS